MTEAEYLRRDHESPSRLDFIDGQIIDRRAQRTAVCAHSQVATNLRIALGKALGTGFRVHGSKLRLGLAGGNFAYTDAFVEVGETQLRHEGASDTLMNPLAVYEVTPDASRAYVRGSKLEAYQATPSIREIAFIHLSGRGYVTLIRGETRWLRSLGIGIRSRGCLCTLGVQISLDEVFAGVEFPQEP